MSFSPPDGPLEKMNELVLAIGGPIARSGIPGLCERARRMLEANEATMVVCDVGALDHPDAVAVDALARLQLTALGLGRRIELLHASGKLQRLLELMGLSDAVPLCGELSLEPERQTEHREQPRGVEEEADPADPIA
jgi:ABC-type transporter Mla MlaB component